jgi:hypothetical protein
VRRASTSWCSPRRASMIGSRSRRPRRRGCGPHSAALRPGTPTKPDRHGEKPPTAPPEKIRRPGQPRAVASRHGHARRLEQGQHPAETRATARAAKARSNIPGRFLEPRSLPPRGTPQPHPWKSRRLGGRPRDARCGRSAAVALRPTRLRLSPCLQRSGAARVPRTLRRRGAPLETSPFDRYRSASGQGVERRRPLGVPKASASKPGGA